MKLKAFLWISIISMTFVACGGSGNEEETGVNPNFSFISTAYQATFYTPGQTEPMNIGFSTEGGDVDINVSPETHPSIYYNAATSSVEWTEELPLGENTVVVTAITASGELTATTIINNTFQGDFEGGYNFNPNSEIITSIDFGVQFNDDGTVIINDEGNSGSGIWEMTEDENEFEFTYSYNAAPAIFYTFRGNLIYDENEAYIDGFFYRGNEASTGNERGYFRIDFN